MVRRAEVCMLLTITIIAAIGIRVYLARKKASGNDTAGPGEATCVGLNGALLDPRK
jgi:hypothetical protein